MALEQDACSAKYGRHWALLSYCDAKSHTAKRLNDKGVRLEVGRAEAAS